MSSSHQIAVGRLKFVFGLFIALSPCIVARFVQLQVVQHEHLKGMADRQHLRSVHIAAKRGNIYDRNGQNLAISVDVPSIAADPSLIQDPRPVAKALSKTPLGVFLAIRIYKLLCFISSNSTANR